MKKITRYAVLALLATAATISTLAASQRLSLHQSHPQFAGGDGPPPCNPLIEHCPQGT